MIAAQLPFLPFVPPPWWAEYAATEPETESPSPPEPEPEPEPIELGPAEPSENQPPLDSWSWVPESPFGEDGWPKFQDAFPAPTTGTG